MDITPIAEKTFEPAKQPLRSGELHPIQNFSSTLRSQSSEKSQTAETSCFTTLWNCITSFFAWLFCCGKSNDSTALYATFEKKYIDAVLELFDKYPKYSELYISTHLPKEQFYKPLKSFRNSQQVVDRDEVKQLLLQHFIIHKETPFTIRCRIFKCIYNNFAKQEMIRRYSLTLEYNPAHIERVNPVLGQDSTLGRGDIFTEGMLQEDRALFLGEISLDTVGGYLEFQQSEPIEDHQ